MITSTTIPHRLDFCYMIMQPYEPWVDHGESINAPLPKDAPYFYELDISFRHLKTAEKSIRGVNVQIQTQVLNDEIWVAECQYTLQGFLNEPVHRFKQAINATLRQSLLEETNYRGSLIEEYTILLISNLNESPDTFVETYQSVLAQLLRSPDRPLDTEQIQLILQSRTRYAADDLTIVDWEGALVISKAADFRTEIDLLKIGNYQLLKYRMVDEQIDRQLQQMRALIGRRLSWFSNQRETLHTIVDNRLRLLLDFETTDQSLLLIGDWYSAQLYRIIFDEFYIDEWKGIVSKKLENLSSIAEVIQANLTLSWSRLLDIFQLVGWMVLLFGYLYLYLKETKLIP
jgi:hypothetical protein